MFLGTLFQQPSVSITPRNRNCEPDWFQEFLCKQEVVSNTLPGHTYASEETPSTPSLPAPSWTVRGDLIKDTLLISMSNNSAKDLSLHISP